MKKVTLSPSIIEKLYPNKGDFAFIKKVRQNGGLRILTNIRNSKATTMTAFRITIANDYPSITDVILAQFRIHSSGAIQRTYTANISNSPVNTATIGLTGDDYVAIEITGASEVHYIVEMLDAPSGTNFTLEQL